MTCVVSLISFKWAPEKKNFIGYYPCTHTTLFQRPFNVHSTSITFGRRYTNVRMTLCAHWDKLFSHTPEGL